MKKKQFLYFLSCTYAKERVCYGETNMFSNGKYNDELLCLFINNSLIIA